MNNKGQSIFSEYVMIIFVVIAAAVAMTTFVQRSLKAKIHDERNFMINMVNSLCDANCLKATGVNSIPYEYEPYYQQFFAATQNQENAVSGITTGNPQVLGVKYSKSFNGEAGSNVNSYQLPPECAGSNPPSYCSNGGL
jgi:hypothetical protein